MHPGAHLGTGEPGALKTITVRLNEVFKSTKRSPVRIALAAYSRARDLPRTDNSALGSIFEEINGPRRLGACLHTAHLFAAGHNFRTPKGWICTIAKVEFLDGLERGPRLSSE